ncbi:hypothetical protein E1B28_009520 [Marasmius oreades]|uniref:Uncharacterized protein n=1 Tax=Marasmius oreades TaxID=181124 RepID=A0A9P7RV85_9AGAR|nr:uncharacterized protein E1B28_009520 [Marasmius oreades]KAG7090401.1 hypothetical protein E1B28_009520 [Marasmius oreades]
MSTLLPFHETILSEIHDPATSDLLIIARGLGLRGIICTLLKIYDGPENLVLLVNTTQEEETEIGEELGLMGCRKPGLRIVGYETGSSRDRQDLYKKGGLIAVTSRILVVDLLQGDIPVDMITGMIFLHAEKISPLHIVSFITRLYREKSTTGFLKAFTDQPEHITSGLSPLKNVMKELGLRRVSIYPRFHRNIKDCLERKREDVVELSQNLTESMAEIHRAIVHCMNMILSDLRRSKDQPIFQDPIWHKVGSTTKGLVRDLGVLRKLVTYLLSYDPLQFHTYCQSLLASINEPESRGTSTGRTSEWTMTDSASTIFQLAKNRCFITVPEPEESETVQKDNRPPTVVDLIDDEDVWDAVNEAEGLVPTTTMTTSSKSKKNHSSQRPKWLPPNLHPVLEELPKWSLLAEILEEIEYEILRYENHSQNAASAVGGTNTTLVMCSGTATCGLLTEFLQKMDTGGNRTKGEWGRKLMLGKLKSWLFWERERKMEKEGGGGGAGSKNRGGGGGGGTAAAADARPLKKKDREKAQKQASRRRVRGGAPSGGSRATTVAPPGGTDTAVVVPHKDDDPWSADIEMQLIALDDEELQLNLAAGVGGLGGIISSTSEFNEYYGLIPPAEQVLVWAYSDDTDDRMLDEIKPRFIVMYEPCMEFVRRVEVYKACNPHMDVRMYHMVYNDSCEEHKYLAGIRREKDSFERVNAFNAPEGLVRERQRTPTLAQRSPTHLNARPMHLNEEGIEIIDIY